MKWRALVILAPLLVGCFRTTIVNGRTASHGRPPLDGGRTGAVLGNLVVVDPPHRLDGLCPNGWAQVDTEVSPLDWLIDAWAPFYSSFSVSVRCSDGASSGAGAASSHTAARPADALKSYGGDEWMTTKGPGWSFSVPSSWQSDVIAGRKVFHPAGQMWTQVFLSIGSTDGTEKDYAKANYEDRVVDYVDIGGRRAAWAVKVDDLNGKKLRITSTAIVKDGTAYELTCADSPGETMSETCKRVLRSLKLTE